MSVSNALQPLKIKHLLNCTRAVFFANDHPEFPYSCGGTAFLVRFRGSIYFVTAKHVAKRFAADAPRILLLPDSSEFFPFNERAVMKTKQTDDTDHADIAIFRVASELVPNVDFGDHAPIDLDTVRIGAVPPPGSRLIFQGFPTDRTHVDYDARKLRHTGVALSGRYGGVAESVACHILEIIDPEKAPTMTLDGYSGSPIFWVAEQPPTYFGFCGVIIRATLTSGKARYVDAEVVIAALLKLSQ